jgi:acyl carrier protein phosphodiesterase
LQFRSEVDAKDFISARHLPRRSVYASDIMYRVDWTDKRMDDFAKGVDRRFDAVDQRFDAVDQRFDAVDQRFDAIDQRFDRLERDVRDLRTEINARFDGLQRTLLVLSGGIIAALIGVIATQI